MKIQIENATTPTETDEEIFVRLAGFSPAEYDRCRKREAKRLEIRVSMLDAEIEKRRPKNKLADTMHGSKVVFFDIEPWNSPVDLIGLLDEIAAILKRFVVAPESAIIVASLFVVHTYAFDLGEISPILFITGPTKRCGKSKFLAILLRLVCRPFAAASATPAGIYRLIELHHPTLGIDEVDAFVRGDEQLRGLINSGHTRDMAFHLGCITTADKQIEPRRWSTWTPKIFSGIGRLADTIEDRAIIIKMIRKRKSEPCERLGHGTRFDEIARKALRFVNDHTEAIRSGNVSPDLPDALNDRAGDNWTPLLVLADIAGGRMGTFAADFRLSSQLELEVFSRAILSLLRLGLVELFLDAHFSLGGPSHYMNSVRDNNFVGTSPFGDEFLTACSRPPTAAQKV